MSLYLGKSSNTALKAKAGLFIVQKISLHCTVWFRFWYSCGCDLRCTIYPNTFAELPHPLMEGLRCPSYSLHPSLIKHLRNVMCQARELGGRSFECCGLWGVYLVWRAEWVNVLIFIFNCFRYCLDLIQSVWLWLAHKLMVIWTKWRISNG